MLDGYRRISWVLGAVFLTCSLAVTALGDRGSVIGPSFVEWTVTLDDVRLRTVGAQCRIYSHPGGDIVLKRAEGSRGAPVPLGLKAFGPDGERLCIEKDDSAWKIKAPAGDITFIYKVVLTVEDRYCPEVRKMLSSVEPARTRIMGSDVFLIPLVEAESGVVVDFVGFPGDGAVCAWGGTGDRVVVPSQTCLPDMMAVFGDFRLMSGYAGGCRISLAAGGDWDFEDEDLFEVIRRVVSVTTGLLGPPPDPEHLFVCEVNPVRGNDRFDYYGLHFPRTVLLFLDSGIDKSRLFDVQMSIVAHEFFHNWNGESIRPADDSFLWFTEGATVYFSYLILEKAGIISSAQAEKAAESIGRRYGNNPLRESVPLEEAANSDLSDRDMVGILYDGGFLAAAELDSAIRNSSGGDAGLIDVIRLICEENPEGIDAGEADLRRAILELTGDDMGRLIRRLTGEPDPFDRTSSLSS